MKYYPAIKTNKKKSPISDIIGRRWEHYAKWNKSDTEGQILYNLFSVWNLKKKRNKQKNHIKIDQACGYQGQGISGEEIEGRWSKSTNFQLQDK